MEDFDTVEKSPEVTDDVTRLKLVNENTPCVPSDIELYVLVLCTDKSIEYNKETFLDNLSFDYDELLNRDMYDLSNIYNLMSVDYSVVWYKFIYIILASISSDIYLPIKYVSYHAYGYFLYLWFSNINMYMNNIFDA